MLNLLKRRWYFIGVVLITGALIFAWNKSVTKAQNTKENKYILKRQDLKEYLSLSGTVDADEHAILRFQSSGRISWVGVKEGDYVKKFQGIASLDQNELQKNLKKYMNTYLKERWDYDQTREDKQIKNIGGLSEDARREAIRVFDKAQFDLDNAVLDVELKEIALRYSYLYTPIEGLVVRVDSPFAGVNITPAQAEFEVINPSTIYFSATADQSDVVGLKQGMSGEIVLDAYPDNDIPGEITMISFIPKTGETGTAYKVKIKMNADNANYPFKYGMTGDISFVTQNKNNVLSIPTSYIKSEKNNKYVLKEEQGKRIKTYVKTGSEIDSETIITTGLKEGDIIYD